MLSNKNIWVIDSDPTVFSIYRELFEPSFSLTCLESLAGFEKQLSDTPLEQAPQLVITESLIQDGDPFPHLTKSFPFLIVSANENTALIRRSFAAGAADYLFKPIRKTEIQVKVERLLNQISCSKPGIDRGIIFSSDEFCLRKNGELRTQLTAKEFQLFSILSGAGTKHVSRQEIQKRVWENVNVSHKTFDVHLFNLRRKMEKFGMEIRFSQFEGYLLTEKQKERELQHD